MRFCLIQTSLMPLLLPLVVHNHAPALTLPCEQFSSCTCYSPWWTTCASRHGGGATSAPRNGGRFAAKGCWESPRSDNQSFSQSASPIFPPHTEEGDKKLVNSKEEACPLQTLVANIVLLYRMYYQITPCVYTLNGAEKAFEPGSGLYGTEV